MNDFDKAYKQHLEELWGKVGFIVNLSQMIEYNLANILAFDEILREFDNADSMYLFEYNTVTYFYGYSIIDYSVFTYSHFRQII